MAWWLDDPATELKFALRSDSSSSLDLARDPLVWVRCLAAVRAPRTARGSGDSSVSSADRAPATFRSAGREPRELRMGLRFPGWKVRRPQEVLSHKSVELVLRTLIPSSSSSLGATSPTSPASPRPLPGHPHPCVSSGLLVFLSRQSQPLAQWNPPWSFLKCIPEPDSESLRGGAWQPAFLPPGYSQEILIISQTWWLLPKLGSSQP